MGMFSELHKQDLADKAKQAREARDTKQAILQTTIKQVYKKTIKL